MERKFKSLMKLSFSLVLILFLSCNSNEDTSFDSLSYSFEKWYFKNHPVEASLKSYKIYDDYFLSNDFKTKEQLVTQKVRSQTRPTERINNAVFIPYERSHRMDAFLLAMHRRRHEIEQPPQELVNLIFEFDHYLDH